MLIKALVTPSYDVVRWGKILDKYDYPRLGYDYYNLSFVVALENIGL